MIDLHSHILPGVDDGAIDLEQALSIARMARDDGIEVMACTPHFMPGLYDNQAADIRVRVAALNQCLIEEDIDLALVVGGDAHVRPDFIECLRKNEILRVHDSRYVLFEPSHVTMPPRLEDLLFNIVDTARKAKDKDGKPVQESSASREAAQQLLKVDPARHAQLTPPPATGLPF